MQSNRSAQAYVVASVVAALCLTAVVPHAHAWNFTDVTVWRASFNGRITGSQVGLGAFDLALDYFAGTVGD